MTKMDKWSYTRLRHFAELTSQEQKDAFINRRPQCKMEDYSKSAWATGIAYHQVIAFWLMSLKLGTDVSLENVKVKQINSKNAQYRLQRYIRNFINNKGIYEKYLQDSEIVEVERSFTETISIGTVALDIPCEGRVDLIIKDSVDTDSLVIIDHKSSTSKYKKKTMTDTWQPYISTLLVEKATGMKVSKVIQIENNIAGKPDFIIRVYGMDEEKRRDYDKKILPTFTEFSRLVMAA